MSVDAAAMTIPRHCLPGVRTTNFNANMVAYVDTTPPDEHEAYWAKKQKKAERAMEAEWDAREKAQRAYEKAYEKALNPKRKRKKKRPQTIGDFAKVRLPNGLASEVAALLNEFGPCPPLPPSVRRRIAYRRSLPAIGVAKIASTKKGAKK